MRNIKQQDDKQEINIEDIFNITKKYEMQQQLSDLKELHRLISECAKAVIFTIDMKMKFKSINPYIYDLLGYTPNEVINEKVAEFNTPSSLKTIANAFREEMKKERKGSTDINRVHELQVQQIHKNGSIVDVEILCTFLRDEENKPTGIFGVSRDISERKKLERSLIESNNFLNSILDNTSILIAYLDRNFNFIKVNRAYAVADQKEIDYFPGKNHFDLYPNQENEEIFKQVIDRGTPYQIFGKPFEYADNPERGVSYWDWSLVPIKNELGIVNSLVLSLQNVTDRISAEKLVRESEKKFREAFNHANFYKDLIAHDMNNILQAIQSSVELYQLSIEKPEIFEEKRDYLGIITENIFNGSQLISNVVKLSELQQTKMPLDLINVNKKLMDAIIFTHKIFQNRNLNINVEGLKSDHYVLANDLIIELFENILINAVKHNINSEIEIRIKVSEVELDNKKYCKIEFTDNGLGIPDEIKKDLFQRREKNTKSKKGMGIGLSLVKQIIESYNGKIWVENKVLNDYTKGSNFVLLIPMITQN
ncbi:MAG: PAS domain-containing sensor histidine kinase [Promethearchaeota archaeon]|nr:MAG: PAS domain-containing sensor histidine kinase [Candidatus Lokiarchaeota archaeon]